MKLGISQIVAGSSYTLQSDTRSMKSSAHLSSFSGLSLSGSIGSKLLVSVSYLVNTILGQLGDKNLTLIGIAEK